MAYPSPIKLDSLFFTGEDKRLAFVVYAEGSSKKDIANDDADRQDLSGFTLSWMVKRHMDDTDAEALVTKTTSDGISLTDASEGEGYVELSAEDIASIVAGRNYHHELKRTDVGNRTVLSFGLFVLNQAVHDGPEPTT